MATIKSPNIANETYKEKRNKKSDLIENNQAEIMKCLISSLNIKDDLKNDIISELKSDSEFISKDSKFTKKFALKLIDKYRGEIIIQNLDKFEDLDIDIAIGLMRTGFDKEVVENLYEFDIDKPTFRFSYENDYDYWLSRDEIIVEEILTYRNWIEILINNLDKFNNDYVARKLIDKNHDEIIIKNLDKFEALDMWIALELMQHEPGYVKDIIKNLDNFENKGIAFHEYDRVEEWEIVEELLSNKDWLDILAENIDKFNSLDSDIAVELIEAGKSDLVVKNIDRFDWIDFVELAKKLIEAWEFTFVVDNIDKFKWVDINMLNKFYSNYFE